MNVLVMALQAFDFVAVREELDQPAEALPVCWSTANVGATCAA